MIKRPAFLVIPAYIVGVTAVLALPTLVPGLVGIVLAALIVLAMATPVSLCHSSCGFDPYADITLWGVVLLICSAFALQFIPADIGPQANDTYSWWQVAFLVTQQALYFGIHAFAGEKS